MEKTESQILLENILNGTDDCAVGDERIDGVITAMNEEYISTYTSEGLPPKNVEALNELNPDQFIKFIKFFDDKMSEKQKSSLLEHIVYNAHGLPDEYIEKYQGTKTREDFFKTNNAVLMRSAKGKKTLKTLYTEMLRNKS